MSRRPPSTCLTADEMKQIAAMKFNETAPIKTGPDEMKSAHRHQNFDEMKSYLASKELEPPK
jgi:hypothetical protein